MYRKKISLNIEESVLLCDVRCGSKVVEKGVSYLQALEIVSNHDPDMYIASCIKNYGQPVIDLYTITHDEDEMRYEQECEEAERWVNERDREELDI